MKDWEIYLSEYLNKRIIHFIDLYFKKLNVETPTIQQICQITDDEIMNSWLSIVSSKELMLFQQKMKNGLGEDQS